MQNKVSEKQKELQQKELIKDKNKNT